MTKSLKVGASVSWKSHGGTAYGTVKRKITSETTIKGHKARASREEPQYIVESDNGGKAAHKPSALTKE